MPEQTEAAKPAQKRAAAKTRTDQGTPAQPSIVEALSQVMDLVRSVGKDSTAPGDIGGFKFRGVDAVVNAVAPALRAVGVVVLPEVLAVERAVTTSRGGRNMMNVYVTTRFTFHGPAGDSLQTVVLGEGSDSGDKATAKAQSVALRVALLQALMLPTDDPDPDTENYERADAEQRSPEPQRSLTAAEILSNDLGRLDAAVLAKVQAEWPFPGVHPSSLNDDQVGQIRAWVLDMVQNPAPAPAADPWAEAAPEGQAAPTDPS